MTGTILNAIAILIGGSLGVLLGGRLPERLRQTVVSGLGLFVLALGVKTFFDTHNSLVPLAGLLAGALAGEWMQVEEGIRRLGAWLERTLMRRSDPPSALDAAPQSALSPQERFVRGFFTASLVFCVGPVAILGSFNDGVAGDYQLLAVKSILDGFASLAFASSLGVGVIFSALPIVIYQGALTLLAVQLRPLMTQPMLDEMSATGGLILMAIAISSLLEIRPIRAGNFLPALVITPLIVAVLTWLGIHWMLN